MKSHGNDIFLIDVNCYHYGSCFALGHKLIELACCISDLSLLSFTVMSILYCVVSSKACDTRKTIGWTKL